VSATDDRALEDLLERLRTRFYGKYRGIVSDVDAATMRIKAKVPSVLGETDTGWCMPCVPYAGPSVGFAFLPEQGSGVWIEFEGGDVSYPIWVGGYWRDGEYPSDAAADVKVIVTVAPLELKLDDSAGSITITDPNGNTVTLDSSGITLANGDSVSVVVSSSSVSVNNGALEVQAS
jgi:phage baseplate assembly protein gpV